MQNQLNPAEIPLAETTFSIMVLRTTPLPFNKTPELVTSSAHPLDDMKNDYQRHNVSLDDLAKIATKLSAAPALTDFSLKEIADCNILGNAPYHFTQIEITPIHILNGQKLDTAHLQQKMAQGVLREPMDFNSAILNEAPKPSDWTDDLSLE